MSVGSVCWRTHAKSRVVSKDSSFNGYREVGTGYHFSSRCNCACARYVQREFSRDERAVLCSGEHIAEAPRHATVHYLASLSSAPTLKRNVFVVSSAGMGWLK